MKRVACLIGLLIASPIVAQEPVQQEREHVVHRGDTLWDIAGFYFSDPFQWPSIYEANTTVVEDPHWIYPDEVLVIPGITGDTEPMPRDVAQTTPRVNVRPAQPSARTVFYRGPEPVPETQQEPTVLSEPVNERVPVKPGEFNSAPFVGNPNDLEVVGSFISALRENRDVGGAPSAHPRDEVFLGYEASYRPAVGERFLLIRVGERMAGGRVLTPTGVIRVTRTDDEVMFGQIETQYGPVHRGQLMIEMPMYPDFMVEEAEEIQDGYDLEGRVIEFIGAPPLPKLADMGFVDLGSRDGVKVGDVFTAYLPPRASRERGLGDLLSSIEELPAENVARLRVLRVGENAATVRVDQLMLPRLEDGIRVRRTHRIP